MTDNVGPQDHLFISYAGEDGDLAEWLTLKLTAEGYRVWCDKFKLLGGESYPAEIDKALKEGTFRLISLLSHYSKNKPNPQKELTTGLNISRERGIDFVIPLNVSNLKPTELPWMTSDITFIPFIDWALGLQQLLKKLSSINAPKTLPNGKEIAAATFLPTETIIKKPEILYLNHLHVLNIPQYILALKPKKNLNDDDIKVLSKNWAFHRINQLFLAFTLPQKNIQDNLKFSEADRKEWRKEQAVFNLNPLDLACDLMRKSLCVRCLQKGLTLSADEKTAYFPKGMLTDDKLHFKNYKGKSTYTQVVGYRTFYTQNIPQKFSYHLAPEFKITRGLSTRLMVQLRVRIHILDFSDQEFTAKSALAKRKKVAKSWWNKEWLDRYYAIISFLSDVQDTIVIGDLPEEQIIISAKLPELKADFGIDEDNIPSPKLLEEVDIQDDEGILEEDDYGPE